MTILVVMIPLSILLLVGAGIAFFWAVDHDQFDDMETPALLPLLDAPRFERVALDGGAFDDPERGGSLDGPAASAPSQTQAAKEPAP